MKLLSSVILAALLLAVPALAQTPKWSGPYTPGHAVKQFGTGVIGDAGGALGSPVLGGGYLTELGITAPGLPECVNDALIGAVGGYHQLCLGANATVGGLTGGFITYNNYGGASPLPLYADVNGTVYQIPPTGSGAGNVIGPVTSVVGNIPIFNNTIGTVLAQSGNGTLGGSLTLSATDAPINLSGAGTLHTGASTVTATGTQVLGAQGPGVTTGLSGQCDAAILDPRCLPYSGTLLENEVVFAAAQNLTGSSQIDRQNGVLSAMAWNTNTYNNGSNMGAGSLPATAITAYGAATVAWESVTGINLNIISGPSANNVALIGSEFAISVQGSCSFCDVLDLEMEDLNGSTTGITSFIFIHNVAITAVGAAWGIHIDGTVGSSPISSSGTVIGDDLSLSTAQITAACGLCFNKNDVFSDAFIAFGVGGSTKFLVDGFGATTMASLTVNGTSTLTGNVSLGAGLSVATSSSFTGAMSANGGLTTTGMLISAAAPPASSGQIGYGGTVTAASSCGSLSGAAGCIVVNVAGTTGHVPYYP